MKSILITLFFILSACSAQQSVIYSSTWKQEHDEEVNNLCRKEAVHLTLVMYEAHGRVWTVQDVMRVEHLILCHV